MKRLEPCKSFCRVAYVYCITSPSGKRYVGKTIDPNRLAAHLRGGASAVLREVVEKHGRDKMVAKIVAVLSTEEEAFRVEAALIRAWDTIIPNGYNLQDGGRGGFKAHRLTKQRQRKCWTKKRRAAQSKRWSGINNPMFGREMSPEHRALNSWIARNRVRTKAERLKISKAHKGKKFTAEHRANLSKAKMGKPIPLALAAAIKANTGRPLSAAHRAKIGAKHRGPLNHAYGKIMSAERRAKCASWNGRKHTTETINKMKVSAKARWANRRKEVRP